VSAPKAERRARELLAQIKAGVPVDVNSAAESLDLSVVEQDLESSVSAMLVVKDGHGVIGVNTNHHPNRRRFSVAHEIGHYLLHRDSASVFVDAAPVFFRAETSAAGTKQQEVEANAFAAELLIPAVSLREQVEQQALDPYDDASVHRLARTFGVSAQALTIKLVKLGLIS
jgi:Zn-dependent peptidase ImmA (M78 family)